MEEHPQWMDCDLYISVPSFLYTYDANKCKSFVSRCIFEFLKTILGQRPPQIQSLPGNTVLSRDSPILFDVGENGLPNMSIVLPTHLVGESRSTPRRAILYNYAKICCLWPIPEEVAALMRQKVDVLRSMLISLEMSPPGSDEQSHDMLSAFIRKSRGNRVCPRAGAPPHESRVCPRAHRAGSGQPYLHACGTHSRGQVPLAAAKRPFLAGGPLSSRKDGNRKKNVARERSIAAQ